MGVKIWMASSIHKICVEFHFFFLLRHFDTIQKKNDLAYPQNIYLQ